MKRFSTISILPIVTVSEVEEVEEGAPVTDAMLFANGIQSIEKIQTIRPFLAF